MNQVKIKGLLISELKKVIAILAVAVAVLFMLSIGALSAWYGLKKEEPFIKQNCPDFNTYQEAKASLAKGNTYLDWNHDGYPCEDQFPREIKAEKAAKIQLANQ